MHRPGYHSLAELASEQVWTDALDHYGIHVPIASRTREGDYFATVECDFATVECDGSTRYVGLVGWLEGRTLNRLSLDSQNLCEKLTELGRLCARMHNQASGWQIPSGFTRHRLNVEGFMGDTPFWGPFWEVPELTPSQRDLILVARDEIALRLTAYGENQRTYSMIHADLHNGNLMVDGESLTVFDFDDAGFGWHQYDLAVALHGYRRREDFDLLQQTIIRGYRLERSIADRDLALLPLVLHVSTLALMGWTHARPELGDSDRISRLANTACKEIAALCFGTIA